MRIGNEKEVLRKELKGYEEYCGKVKWRLLPGVW
jgi:protein-S-isoprenylcysteine O-methyltransferase Ste14